MEADLVAQAAQLGSDWGNNIYNILLSYTDTLDNRTSEVLKLFTALPELGWYGVKKLGAQNKIQSPTSVKSQSPLRKPIFKFDMVGRY